MLQLLYDSKISNGKSADKYFGKDAKVSLDGTTARYRIDNVSLNEARTHMI